MGVAHRHLVVAVLAALLLSVVGGQPAPNSGGDDRTPEQVKPAKRDGVDPPAHSKTDKSDDGAGKTRHVASKGANSGALSSDLPPLAPVDRVEHKPLTLPQVKLPLVGNKLLGDVETLIGKRTPVDRNVDPTRISKLIRQFTVADLRMHRSDDKWHCRWWVQNLLGAQWVGYDVEDGRVTRIALYFKRFGGLQMGQALRLLDTLNGKRINRRVARLTLRGEFEKLPLTVVYCRQMTRAGQAGGKPKSGGAALVEIEVDPVHWRLSQDHLDAELAADLKARRIVTGLTRSQVEAILGRVKTTSEQLSPVQTRVTYYRPTWPFDKRVWWRVTYVGGQAYSMREMD